MNVIYVFTYDPHLNLFINIILNGYHLIDVVICEVSLSIIRCILNGFWQCVDLFNFVPQSGGVDQIDSVIKQVTSAPKENTQEVGLYVC